MPCCDNRHWRNQRNELAIRLICHEVRNSTIRSWTGLSDHQIRQLCGNVRSASTTKPLRRRRGRPPRQASFFTRSPHLQLETAQLCSTLTSCGLFELALHEPPETRSFAYHQLFCDAFETHEQLFADPCISFEHAWYLLELLKHGRGHAIMPCRRCQGIYLCNGSSASRRACPCCRSKTIG